MADVLDAFARDGHGGVIEDGESELVDRAREWLNRPAQRGIGEHEIIARFLERTCQYVTNDASREAAVAEAVAADRSAREQALPPSLGLRALLVAMDALEKIGDFVCDSTEDDAWLLKNDALSALERIANLTKTKEVTQ